MLPIQHYNSDEDSDYEWADAPTDPPKCVICLGGEYDEFENTFKSLINPCNCMGETGSYHYRCLVPWIISSQDRPCNTCGHKFVDDRIIRYQTQMPQIMSIDEFIQSNQSGLTVRFVRFLNSRTFLSIMNWLFISYNLIIPGLTFDLAHQLLHQWFCRSEYKLYRQIMERVINSKHENEIIIFLRYPNTISEPIIYNKYDWHQWTVRHFMREINRDMRWLRWVQNSWNRI